MFDKTKSQHKIKVMYKLYEYGCVTEKQLQQLGMEEILKIPSISISDIAVIIEFQKSVKSGRLYSYLSGTEKEEKDNREVTEYGTKI